MGCEINKLLGCSIYVKKPYLGLIGPLPMRSDRCTRLQCISQQEGDLHSDQFHQEGKKRRTATALPVMNSR